MKRDNKYSYTRFSVKEYEAKQDELGFTGPGSRSADGLYVLADCRSESKCVDCNQSLKIPKGIPTSYPVNVNGVIEQRPLTDNDPHYSQAQVKYIRSLPYWRGV